VFGEPGQGSLEEPDGGHGPLVGEDFDVGQPGGVIDADMDGFPAGPVGVASWSLTEGPFAGLGEPAELLDVEVDQLAGMAAAVAVGGSTGPSFQSRFRPRRFRITHTVEVGIPKVAAILVDVIRSRRRRSTAASILGGVLEGRRRGADERSVISSPASKRASHR
jgi:hypothetical protein